MRPTMKFLLGLPTATLVVGIILLVVGALSGPVILYIVKGNLYHYYDYFVARMLYVYATILSTVMFSMSGLIVAGLVSLSKQRNYTTGAKDAIYIIIAGFFFGPPGWIFLIPFGIFTLFTGRKDVRQGLLPPKAIILPKEIVLNYSI